MTPHAQQWSEIKRSTSSTGSLIPLTFSSRDPSSRAHAIKTMTAYTREHNLILAAVINCVDARGMRSGSYAETISTGTSCLSEHSPAQSEVIEARSGGLKKRKTSMGQQTSETLYEETPVPLSIASEEHMKDLLAEVIGVIGIVQDALPLLRSVKGRVVNVWSCAAPIGFGRALTFPKGSPPIVLRVVQPYRLDRSAWSKTLSRCAEQRCSSTCVSQPSVRTGRIPYDGARVTAL